MLICYTLRLFSATGTKVLASPLLQPRMATALLAIIGPGAKTYLIQEKVSSTTLKAATALISSAARGSALCSDLRTGMRLFGLVDMLLWLREHWLRGSSTPMQRRLTWVRIAALTAYYGLEHTYYLTGHGVLPLSPEIIAPCAAWSCRFWAIDLVAAQILDMLSCPKELKERVMPASQKEKNSPRSLTDQEFVWLRQTGINVAYLILAVNWSMKTGYLSDAMVGLIGSLTACGQLSKAWEASA